MESSNHNSKHSHCHGNQHQNADLKKGKRGALYHCKKHSESFPETISRESGSCSICSEKLVLWTGNYYRCPMCSGVFSLSPSDCPKCGMELVLARRVHKTSDADKVRQANLHLRLALALPLSLATMAVSMIPMLNEAISKNVFLQWMPFFLSTPVVLWCGLPLLQKGVKSFIRSLKVYSLNMYSLIFLGVGLAYGFSTLVLIAKTLALLAVQFPLASHIMEIPQINQLATIPIYFESAASIVSLILLGEVIENSARKKSGDAISSLLSISPKKAHRLNSNGADVSNITEDINVESIRVGDMLRVLPGETIPADGVVHEGESRVNEAMLTGEAFPVAKTVGSRVSAGTSNQQGSVIMKVESTGEDTTLSRIIAKVENAMQSRAPIEKTVDRISKVFVPVVVVCAIVAFVSWSAFAQGAMQQRLFLAVIAAVSTLIIACPCAMGLATPISIMMAAKKGAGRGLFFQNAISLERIGSIGTLFVDKTGTLTVGRPEIVEMHNFSNLHAVAYSDVQLLYFAAAIESASEHPLAKAFSRRIQKITAKPTNGSVATLDYPKKFKAILGRGVSARLKDQQHLLGNAKLMQENAIDLPDAIHRATAVTASYTVVYHAIDGKVVALYKLQDKLREGTIDAIQTLQKWNVKVIMLSGDRKAVCAEIAGKLGIEEYFSELTPEAKAEKIEAKAKKIKQASTIARKDNQKRTIAMLGDGINDAPALATAEVGIAVGEGSEVAIETADLVLVEGSLPHVVSAIRLSTFTQRNIWQNLGFAFGYNSLGVPLAAGALYPSLGITLHPMIAAAAMATSSICVIANALRLAKAKI